VKAILDTSVVLGERGDSLQGDLAISVVTLAELHFGVLMAADGQVRAERLRRLAFVEANFGPLAVDAAVARNYGALAAATAAIGRQPRARALDLLIAATARAHHARLYTANPQDLRGLEDLVEIAAV